MASQKTTRKTPKGNFALIVLLVLLGLGLYVYRVFKPTPIKIAEVGTSTPYFSDVATSHPFYSQIQAIRQAGLSGGCTDTTFCPDAPLTRAQAAVILLRIKNGASYTPPDTATIFTDAKGHWAEDWIEALRVSGISGGCTNTTFCPDDSVSRGQFAVLLLRTKHGSSYTPTSTTTTFGDTTSHWARYWIEDLKTQGITSGCGGGNYCPDSPVSRGEMAVFIVNTFPQLVTVTTNPVNGACGATHYNCVAGTRGDYLEYASEWQWWCNGTGGGTNILCSEPKTAAPSPSPSPSPIVGYLDVPNNHLFYTFITALTDAGIVGGCGNNNFCPDDALSRAQAAVVLLRAKHNASYTPPDVASSFTDVPANYWAKNWIEALKNQGIASGCGGTNFCPDSPVTRAQFAVMLLRTKYGSNYAPLNVSSTFSDTANHWAEDWIEQLKKENITTGCGGGKFCPESTLTRGQMTALLYAALLSPNRTFDPTPSPSPSPSAIPSPSALPFPAGDLTEDYIVDLNDFRKLITFFGNPYDLLDFRDIITNYGTNLLN